MRFSDWEPIYEEILEEFGFSREEDEEAARLLQSLLLGREGDHSPEYLSSMIKGREILVCGNGPSLPQELKNVLESSMQSLALDEPEPDDLIVIAADGATTRLFSAGVLPDVIVTDLDGFLPDIIAANARGSVVVVHAHGDNMAVLREFVPQLRRVLGTTQAEPIEGIYNFGGFSDFRYFRSLGFQTLVFVSSRISVRASIVSSRISALLRAASMMTNLPGSLLAMASKFAATS
ncbi:MAG: 6-hydroxymethyl-7,8-dihydropterin pyrophosphokinase [Methanothrix harundinacea]|uniref:6-hydroxymethyl-7,8-dihydropterin pyrophosphokinase n=1 Tax=Methanothrix harundinacea TaxID=301375 RepID=A0A101FUU2_9EURY|nr:MAG: 6-hydroxymethyl-7,8-dihydropterin pyrophosphokinase [Methanothrix harundinacea]